MKNYKNSSGNQNSGDYNSGDFNSGNYNSGDYNLGIRNSGSRNSGYYNSGYYNTGNYNSGNYNSGDYNTGIRNSGYFNSGNYNSGIRNSGYYNTGNYNSGNYNSGDYNSGYFNTDTPTIRMFNKDTGKTHAEISIPYVILKTTEWIDEHQMTEQQKLDDPKFHIKGGTLINRSYKEAWKIYWEEASEKDKQAFLNLPNFCPRIFKEITGIDVDNQTCNNKIVEIDGRKYKLTEITEGK